MMNDVRISYDVQYVYKYQQNIKSIIRIDIFPFPCAFAEEVFVLINVILGLVIVIRVRRSKVEKKTSLTMNYS